ncbi:MAG: porin [Burkholderiales bacterium]
MNKKLITLAVAGAFAAPAAALAQASNVQVFGTMYMEYAYAKQGQLGAGVNGIAPGGDLINVDILQTPGSEVGIKGEEALGGGTTVWFQCTSTADIRGAGTAGFCSRNSAIGLKGRFGNFYVGNWDMPMKKVAGTARITSDTGIWGVGRMMFGDSSTFANGNGGVGTAASGIAFSRRQNSSLHYDTPVFGGFQGFLGVSTTTQSIAQTTVSSGAKPRVWGVAGSYNNGPLYLTLGYENHSNFGPAAGLGGNVGTYSGTDTGWLAGAAYTFGPVKVGLLYSQRKYDMSANGATDLKITAWNLAGQWNIAGPHGLRGGYTRANDTKGSFGTAIVPVQVGQSAGGGLVGNAGAGSTGGSIYQIQYVYSASKRTEFTAGYVALQNDSNARYTLGGLSAGTVQSGQNQHAFAVSMKNTF